VVLILSYDEFIRFSDQVETIHSMHYNEKRTSNEKIYMHTDSSKLALAFTHKEWMKLYQLLEESRFMLYAKQFIDRH
jgi:predicted transcriptional regulator